MKKRADIVAADTTGQRRRGKDGSRRLSPTHEEIAQLAFSLYESGGRQDGHHIEDWLCAERELVQSHASLRSAGRSAGQYTRPIEMASIK